MVQPSVLVLKGETDRGKAKPLRAFPPVSYGRAQPVVEREHKKGPRTRYEQFRRSQREADNGRERTDEEEHKTATSISACFKERAKTVERKRMIKNMKMLRAFPPVS